MYIEEGLLQKKWCPMRDRIWLGLIERSATKEYLVKIRSAGMSVLLGNFKYIDTF